MFFVHHRKRRSNVKHLYEGSVSCVRFRCARDDTDYISGSLVSHRGDNTGKPPRCIIAICAFRRWRDLLIEIASMKTAIRWSNVPPCNARRRRAPRVMMTWDCVSSKATIALPAIVDRKMRCITRVISHERSSRVDRRESILVSS